MQVIRGGSIPQILREGERWVVFLDSYGDLKQTTMATATGTLEKRFNGQNKS